MSTADRAAAEGLAPAPGALGRVGALWGSAGLAALLMVCALRLWPHAVDGVREVTTLGQALGGALIVAGIAWAEGYRGFWCGLSPLVAARSRWLAQHPRPLLLLMAPVFTLGMLHATRRRLIRAWALTAMITGFIVAVPLLPSPWRGLIDLGVVVGLSVGALSILARTCQGAGSDPEVPAAAPRPGAPW
jgi:hypothetical protein